MKEHITDQGFVDLILKGDRHALTIVYKKHRLFIQNYITSHRGNREDAQDVYQEVMMVFYANIVSGRLICLQGKLSTYLYKVAQNVWHNRQRLREPLAHATALTDYPIERSINTAKEDALLHQLMNGLDYRCREMLTLFYFERLPMKKIAERMGMDQVESARKRKWDCLEKLRKLVQKRNEEVIRPALEG